MTDLKLPICQQVGGKLLQSNYDAVVKENNVALLSEADTFGLTFLGDGATIKKMPLINVLAMSGSTPPTVLAIHDCTLYMAQGGKKDAPYIASFFEPYIETLDPDGTLTDIIFFDGAANVQKAGELMAAILPGAYCLHGGEHLLALFFSDVAKLKKVKVTQFYKMCFM
jgi:hypothetical protein